MQFLVFIGLLLSTELIASESIAVIVNSHNPQHTMDIETVRAYFLKEQKLWPSGETVISFARPVGSPIHAHFIQSVLNKSEGKLENHWIKLKQGGEMPPQIIPTDKLVISMVKKFPWAISYVDKSALAQSDSEISVVLEIQ